MKELLKQYSGYNLWANKLMIQTAEGLSEEQLTQEIVSSFPSILKTFIHLMDVESIWWQRLKLAEQIVVPSQGKELTFKETSTLLLESSTNWKDWVMNANEHNFSHVFEYRNTKKELFKQPVYEVILHLVNHQTYHRGQLVTMMRQVGATNLPSTDFIAYSRKAK